ncbi:MAG TPA: (2Fe-2S) ferredoxin domain-containing protein [Xenococcaceae cyanobacterium]
MKTKVAQQSTYQIEGEFRGFIPKPDGEFKYMQVQVKERLIPIKLAKELREPLSKKLVEGDRLAIFLESTGSGNLRKLKLKSDRIEKIATSNSSLLVESTSSKTVKSTKKSQGKILLCRKSSCAKRGGKQLYSALTETLEQLGLQDQVTIELTGCQKQCKKAPSLILMPGKVKHAYVNPNELTSLLKAHYL